MQKIQPFIWFKDNAEEAMQFYTTLFADSKIVSVTKLEGTPGPANSMVGVFELMGQRFMCILGGENPMLAAPGPISLVVNCDTQEEIDKLWDAFSAGGTPNQCGWITDKFGITWQVVPTKMGELMGGPDAEGRKRTTAAMLKMIKLDINVLQAAYDGA